MFLLLLLLVVTLPACCAVVHAGVSFARAAHLGDVETLRRLVLAGQDINELDEKGATALMHASAEGNAASVRFLLEEGADASVRAPGSSMDALRLAELWRAKHIKEIEGKGKSFQKQTPLHLDAKLNDFSEIVELLKSAEACEASRAEAARKAEEYRLLHLPPAGGPHECVNCVCRETAATESTEGSQKISDEDAQTSRTTPDEDSQKRTAEGSQKGSEDYQTKSEGSEYYQKGFEDYQKKSKGSQMGSKEYQKGFEDAQREQSERAQSQQRSEDYQRGFDDAQRKKSQGSQIPSHEGSQTGSADPPVPHFLA